MNLMHYLLFLAVIIYSITVHCLKLHMLKTILNMFFHLSLDVPTIIFECYPWIWICAHIYHFMTLPP